MFSYPYQRPRTIRVDSARFDEERTTHHSYSSSEPKNYNRNVFKAALLFWFSLALIVGITAIIRTLMGTDEEHLASSHPFLAMTALGQMMVAERIRYHMNESFPKLTHGCNMIALHYHVFMIASMGFMAGEHSPIDVPLAIFLMLFDVVSVVWSCGLFGGMQPLFRAWDSARRRMRRLE